MFWLQKKIWLECFGLILVASVVSIFAWATTHSPDELELEYEKKVSALTLKEYKLEAEAEQRDLQLSYRYARKKLERKNRIDRLSREVRRQEDEIETLLNFRQCAANCSQYAVKEATNYWRLQHKVAVGPDTLSNRRFEELLRCNQVCFVE